MQGGLHHWCLASKLTIGYKKRKHEKKERKSVEINPEQLLLKVKGFALQLLYIAGN